MKVNLEVDCTPEEARRFLGLPDVTKANEAYTEAMTKAIKGAVNLDQLQDLAKGLAPMGMMGMKMFQQMVEGGMAMAGAAAKKRGD